MRWFSTRKRPLPTQDLKWSPSSSIGSVCPNPPGSVVYKAREPGGFLSFKKTWAIRCFLRPISDHAERYEAISKHLGKVRLPYDVNFQFLKQGIQIRSSWFPIVKMQWADGDLLHSHIE